MRLHMEPQGQEDRLALDGFRAVVVVGNLMGVWRLLALVVVVVAVLIHQEALIQAVAAQAERQLAAPALSS